MGPVEESGAHEFTDEHAFGRKTLFLRAMWFQGRRSKVSVSAIACLDLGKLSTKSAQDCGESSICISKSHKHGVIGALLDDAKRAPDCP